MVVATKHALVLAKQSALELMGGHKNTKIAICLECFEAKKTKFWLSRYNQSTVKDHIRTTHKGSISAARIVPEDAIGAKDAMNEYERQTKSRY